MREVAYLNHFFDMANLRLRTTIMPTASVYAYIYFDQYLCASINFILQLNRDPKLIRFVLIFRQIKWTAGN